MSRRDLLLWISVLAGPIVWLVAFGANFGLTPHVCNYQSKVSAYAVSIIALILTAGGAYLGWKQWTELGREYPGEWGGAVARGRFMALSGTVLGAGFFLVILAQAIPQVVFAACE